MNIQNIKKEIEENRNLKDFFETQVQTSDKITLMSGWDSNQTDLVYYIHGKLHTVDMLWNKKVNNLFSFIKEYDRELYERLRYVMLISISASPFLKISNPGEEEIHTIQLTLIHTNIPVLCEDTD